MSPRWYFIVWIIAQVCAIAVQSYSSGAGACGAADARSGGAATHGAVTTGTGGIEMKASVTTIAAGGTVQITLKGTYVGFLMKACHDESHPFWTSQDARPGSRSGTQRKCVANISRWHARGSFEVPETPFLLSAAHSVECAWGQERLESLTTKETRKRTW